MPLCEYLFKEIRKDKKGIRRVSSDSIYKNLRARVFEFQGKRYCIDSSFFEGLDSETKVRRKFKRYGKETKHLVYEIENSSKSSGKLEQLSLLEVTEDRKIRSIIFGVAIKDRGIRFYSNVSKKDDLDFKPIRLESFSCNYGCH